METDDIAKEIKNLNTKKAILQDNILVKILKLNNDMSSEIFNESIEMTISIEFCQEYDGFR